VSDEGDIQAPSGDVIARGLTSAWERLGPLSTGAVATSLLLVTGGRLFGRAVGLGVGRRFGLSAAVGMLSLGLWLVTGPGKAANSEREGADRAADN
jgi:hypothetical protein